MIRFAGICRDYRLGGQVVHALADINLEIGAGEYISIMGPSGSGKSTLLNLIALLDQPSSGTYLLNGRDVTDLPEEELARTRRENFGFVFQFFHLIPRLNAGENIAIPMTLAGIAPAERNPRVAQAIAAFGLSGRAGHKPDQLSGGERQRVAIARATIMQPSVILADEPTGNLDQATGRQVIELLEQLNAGGVTLVMVTHDQNIGDRALRRIRLVDGRIDRDTNRGSG